MKTDYSKNLNNKPGDEIWENHKRDGETISGRKEQVKGLKPYS